MRGRAVEPAARLRCMSISRLGATLLALAFLCGGAVAKDKDDPFCAPLNQAIAAAAGDDAFASVTGNDAGLYNESSLLLPDAKLCTTNLREKPRVWRCHVDTNDRYTLALELHGATLRRIEACLGEGWATEWVQDKRYLRLDVVSHGADRPRVQVLTTVAPKYRLVVTVFAAN